MTDLEIFIEIYKSIGIELHIIETNDTKELCFGFKDRFLPNDDMDTHEKFGGFQGFYTQIVFNLDGEFLQQNFWE